MTLRDWISGSLEDIDEHGLSTGVTMSGQELARGGVKRAEQVRPIGTPIWKKDWDVLVVLDACRPDHLQSVMDQTWLADVEATFDVRWSEASCSRQWISRAIDGAKTEDKARLAYLTGNPFSGQEHEHTSGIPLNKSEFAELWEGWRHHWGVGPDNIPTMPPGPLTDRAIDTWRHRKQRDVEKLIIHYMQPHYPIVTQPGIGNSEYTHREMWGDSGNLRIFEQLRRGLVNDSELQSAFIENTRWILDEIEPLATNMDAQVAISADHGNAFGEWGVYGHPEGELAPAVRRVPWVTFDATDKGEYQPDIPILDEQSGNDINSQLKALGYR